MGVFHKYPEIVTLDKRREILAVKEVIATEKLHGTNLRLFFPDGMTSIADVQFGGRNEVFGTDDGGKFYGGRPVRWFKSQPELLQRMWDFFKERGYSDVIVYGEICGAGIQKGVRYVKEEVTPGGQRMSALIRAAGDRLHGVFGGQNGLWLLNELDRGACGNMPASGLVDVHVQIYALYKEGKRADAEVLSLRLLPLLNLGSQYGVAFAKELLWRRGVIRTNVTRDPQASPLDQHDLADLERFLDQLRPALMVEV